MPVCPHATRGSSCLDAIIRHDAVSVRGGLMAPPMVNRGECCVRFDHCDTRASHGSGGPIDIEVSRIGIAPRPAAGSEFEGVAVEQALCADEHVTVPDVSADVVAGDVLEVLD